MKLSIITGTRNRRESLRRLVASVELRTQDVDWELLVGEASDRPEGKDAGWSSRVSVIPETPRLGPAAGYNRLASFATGDYLCWLNDDVEVLPGWASAMLGAIVSLRGALGVGLGAFYYWTPQSGKFIVQRHRGLLYANFGCLELSLFRDVGGFDTECWKYGMDNSLTFRVMDLGLGVIAVPEARLLHYKSGVEYEEPEDRDRQMHAVAYLDGVYGQRLAAFVERQREFEPERLEFPVPAEGVGYGVLAG